MRLATEERETDMRYASSGTAHRPDSTPSEPGSFHVLIAGAGPAGVEAALTLERIAGGRVVTTIVAPEARFVHFPPAVLSPFAAGNGRRPALDVLADAHVRLGTLDSVDSVAREVRLRDGETLSYDALLIAVGGIQRSPYPRALAFGTPESEERMHGLIQDLEGGYIKRIAFVVPSAASWPLPIYELALMTAERAFDMCAERRADAGDLGAVSTRSVRRGSLARCRAPARGSRDRCQEPRGGRDAAAQRARTASER